MTCRRHLTPNKENEFIEHWAEVKTPGNADMIREIEDSEKGFK